MPTGTGKTVCLLSLILSYIKAKKPTFKFVYCTRTIVEMEKTLEELKFVLKMRELDFADGPEEERHLAEPILAMCLSSRKNLCIHPVVGKEDDRQRVDAMCRSLTASWVRDKELLKEDKLDSSKMVVDIEDLDKNLCSYYEGFYNKADSYNMPKGVFTLDDLKELGRKENMCPYFLARHFLI